VRPVTAGSGTPLASRSALPRQSTGTGAAISGPAVPPPALWLRHCPGSHRRAPTWTRPRDDPPCAGPPRAAILRLRRHRRGRSAARAGLSSRVRPPGCEARVSRETAMRRRAATARSIRGLGLLKGLSRRPHAPRFPPASGDDDRSPGLGPCSTTADLCMLLPGARSTKRSDADKFHMAQSSANCSCQGVGVMGCEGLM